MEDSLTNKKWVLLLNSFFQFIYLNLLWLLFSLPIVTFWPATAALFGVVRKWSNKEEIDTFHTFKSLFKENFVSSILTGIIWSFLCIILFLDFYFINGIPGSLYWIGLVLFGVAVSVFVFTSVYLLPVMINFKTNTRDLWKNSFFIAIMYPHMTLLIIFVGLINGFLLFRYPILIFVVGSLGAYYHYSIINRIFKRLIHENNQTP